MGCFYPFVSKAMTEMRLRWCLSEHALLALRVGVCALVANTLLMHHPLDGKTPVAMSEWKNGPAMVWE